MGKPEPPPASKPPSSRKAALATNWEFIEAEASGQLSLKRTVEPWTIVLLDQRE